MLKGTKVAGARLTGHARPRSGHCQSEKGGIGGAEGDRTLDLCIANAALSQLSYRPTNEGRDCKEPPPGQQAKGPDRRLRALGVPFATHERARRDAAPTSASSPPPIRRWPRETEGQALDPALLRPGVRAVLDGSLRSARYYIAEIDGQAVGQLMTTFEWSDWRNGLFLWIQSVYVTAGRPRLGRFPRAVCAPRGAGARRRAHLRHPPVRRPRATTERSPCIRGSGCVGRTTASWRRSTVARRPVARRHAMLSDR